MVKITTFAIELTANYHIMHFTVPGLNGYFGGKGASGVHQQIINIIPPHDTFIVPFLGHCAVTRSIRPAKKTLCVELDRDVFEAWVGSFIRIEEGNENYKWEEFAMSGHSYFNNIQLYNKCGIEFLSEISHYFLPFENRPSRVYENPVIYCDPPYHPDTRLSDKKYKNDWDHSDHVRFLSAAIIIDFPVLISHKANELYDRMLYDWNTITFNSQTRGGTPQKETVYFNFDRPKQLHDYSYFGNDYRERENYTAKKKRLLAKWEDMEPIERNFYRNALEKARMI